MGNWPIYNDMVTKQRVWKEQTMMTPDLVAESDRHTANYQLGMEHLVRLDIVKALPLFKDYLIIMNELVEHPDPRYIDCEEAYKQCLWLENRGYKPKTTGIGAGIVGGLLANPASQCLVGFQLTLVPTQDDYLEPFHMLENATRDNPHIITK